MRAYLGVRGTGLLAGAILLAAAAPLLAQAAAETSHPVTFTVTSVGGDGKTAVAKGDVQLRVRNQATPIESWASDENLFLAILIDDNIATAAGSHWNDLRAFIMEQPAKTHVAVGFLRNNGTTLAQDFTTNHELAANALRPPMGLRSPASPYLGVIDMLRRWPKTGPRRSIVLISSGFDYFRGSGAGPIFPDVDPLVRRAQDQNTNLWTIYFPSASKRGRSFNYAWTGINNLSRVADETGGDVYSLGTGTPVSLQPHFQDIAQNLRSQYLLTFKTALERRARRPRVSVTSEAPDAEFFYPAAVNIPAAQ